MRWGLRCAGFAGDNERIRQLAAWHHLDACRGHGRHRNKTVIMRPDVIRAPFKHLLIDRPRVRVIDGK